MGQVEPESGGRYEAGLVVVLTHEGVEGVLDSFLVDGELLGFKVYAFYCYVSHFYSSKFRFNIHGFFISFQLWDELVKKSFLYIFNS